MPSMSIAEVKAQLDQLRDILYSSLMACSSPDPDHIHVPFTAEAIVANPPVYAHTHLAEKLGLPLHIVFTMPYTPTKVRGGTVPHAHIEDAAPATACCMCHHA